MDVLSEVLKVVRLGGALFFNAEFSAPWCLNSSSSATYAPYLSPGAERLIFYHFLTEGRAYASLPGGSREELTAGDIVMLPHGDAHVLGNGSAGMPVDPLRAFAGDLPAGPAVVVRFGGGGEITRFVCGYLACDARLSDIFLAGLPALLRVRIAGDPSGQWLGDAIRISVEAATVPNAGSGLVLARLSEVLFVEALRRYIGTLGPDQTGWFAGARDPVIGHILALLHKNPANPWTVQDLAKHAGVSRTRLSERFRHLLGESPIAYLTRWRLKLAAETLEASNASIAEIAAGAGYRSEAAFNRAFRRAFGCPPAQFRRERKTASMRSRDSQPESA